jgi:hypothetical protein
MTKARPEHSCLKYSPGSRERKRLKKEISIIDTRRKSNKLLNEYEAYFCHIHYSYIS